MIGYVSVEQLEAQLKGLTTDLANLQGAIRMCEHLITLANTPPAPSPPAEPVLSLVEDDLS